MISESARYSIHLRKSIRWSACGNGQKEKHEQGRRRVLKSGTAIEHHRCSPSAEGTSGGEHERGFDPLS